MIRICAIFMILAVPNLYAQTQLTIVGTVHKPTEKINSDTLYNLLVKLEPDIFLIELDSIQRLEHLNSEDSKTNENLAITRYKKVFPKVLIEPFDLTNREDFLKKNHYWQKIGIYNKVLDSLITNQRLDEPSKLILEAFADISTYTQLFERQSATLQLINSEEATKAIELRNKWEYDKVPLLVNRNPYLKEVATYASLGSEYWHMRNKAMAKNILAAIKKYPNKRLVVFVGNNHRFYLLNELVPLEQSLKFTLKKFVDF